MTPSEFQELSQKITNLEKAIAKLTATMLPSEESTPAEQVIAETAGLSVEQKLAHWDAHFKRSKKC